MEGHDDRCLDLARQKAAQADRRHAVEQHFAVAGVALVTGRQTTFLVVLQQRLMQRRDHMGRGSEAPLAGLGHVGMLILQVHGQGWRITFGGGQGGFVGEDETHARHTFQALAGGGDQGVERHFAGIDRQCAE
ncbi:hypothetical protein D3C84_665640 [compost metagenome]